eukprot:1784804-Rhodomonas_salina.1
MPLRDKSRFITDTPGTLRARESVRAPGSSIGYISTGHGVAEAQGDGRDAVLPSGERPLSKSTKRRNVELWPSSIIVRVSTREYGATHISIQVRQYPRGDATTLAPYKAQYQRAVMLRVKGLGAYQHYPRGPRPPGSTIPRAQY